MTSLDPGKRPPGSGYLAGIGASGALVAAAAVASVFLIAIVAFDAWPSGGGAQSAQTSAAAQTAPAAGQAAATALEAGPAAVAASATPVVLAQDGNPNSVVTEDDLQPQGGGAAGAAPGSGLGTVGAATELVNTPPVPADPVTGLLGGVVAATEPLTVPLLQTVAGAGTTIEGLLTTTTPALLGALAPGLNQGLGQTLTGVAGTVNGLLTPGGAPVPAGPTTPLPPNTPPAP